jgi:DNA-binding protein H-NS
MLPLAVTAMPTQRPLRTINSKAGHMWLPSLRSATDRSRNRLFVHIPCEGAPWPLERAASPSHRSETVAAARALSDALRRDASALWVSWIGARNHEPGKRSRVAWKLAKGAVAIFILVALVFCGSMLWVLRDLPLDGVSTARERAILLEAADGKPLGCVGPLKVSNAPQEEFPKHLVDAVLSIEDRRFFAHWVSTSLASRALRHNYASGATLQGGSTITQQLVKLAQPLQLDGRIKTAIASARERERAALKEEMAILAAKRGISLKELFGGRTKSKISAPKFANPENPSETWTGRGRKPNWLVARLKKGSKVEDFAI